MSQVIAAPGKPFQGQIAPHMLTATAGKAGVLQAGGQGNWSGSFCLGYVMFLSSRERVI